MHQCLIIYSTTDGHTKKICERVADTIQESSQIKLLCLTKAFTEDLSHYDSIVIGASIKMYTIGRGSIKVGLIYVFYLNF